MLLLLNLRKTNRSFYISFANKEDLLPFFENQSDAELCARLFTTSDTIKSGRIYLSQVVDVVYDTFKDRKALYKTLASREDLSTLLHRIVEIFFWLAMVAVMLTVFGVDVLALLLPAGTVQTHFQFHFISFDL